MTGIEQNGGRYCAGFTLLELLVVVALMALATGIALPLLNGKPTENLRLRAAVYDLTGAIRATRAAAILHNTQAVLIVDVDDHTFTSPVPPARSFAPEIAAQLQVAAPERLSPSRGGIRFYPDGTSTGGDVRLSLHGRESRVCVNWLTGEPRVDSQC
jgi:general secretion pathway protein H